MLHELGNSPAMCSLHGPGRAKGAPSQDMSQDPYWGFMECNYSFLGECFECRYGGLTHRASYLEWVLGHVGSGMLRFLLVSSSL